MAKSQNPVESFRREQKKKESKRLRNERQKNKLVKLANLEPEQLKPEINRLKRQLELDPNDGQKKKRKSDVNALENILVAAVKKQSESKAGQKDAVHRFKKSEDENSHNENRSYNPKNSIHYHPTLNPYGAPPPGQPQMYHTHSPQSLPSSHSNSSKNPQNALIRKRPPLPLCPPPPSSIQVPRRPPVPAGAVPIQAPPPPPLQILTNKQGDAMSMQFKATKLPPSNVLQNAPKESSRIEESDVIAPYPHPKVSVNEEAKDGRIEDADAYHETVSFLPTCIRVHRKIETRTSIGRVGSGRELSNNEPTDEKLKDFLSEINTLPSK